MPRYNYCTTPMLLFAEDLLHGTSCTVFALNLSTVFSLALLSPGTIAQDFARLRAYTEFLSRLGTNVQARPGRKKPGQAWPGFFQAWPGFFLAPRKSSDQARPEKPGREFSGQAWKKPGQADWPSFSQAGKTKPASPLPNP